MARSKRVDKFVRGLQSTDKNHPNGEATGNDSNFSILKKHRILLILLAFLAFMTFFGGLTLGFYSLLQYKFVAKGPAVKEQVFVVPKGTGSSAIAAQLDQDGLISSARLFKLLVKFEKGESRLKAGEYMIPRAASMRDIYEIIETGKAVLYPFTVAEGRTSAQVMRAMDKIDTMIDDDPSIPPEGSLLPETYMTPRGMSQTALIKQMQDNQRQILDRLWPGRAPDLPFTTRREAIILASIVEKETGIASERDKVAGVFVNRLRRGIKLQSDPTIIYGETGGEPLGRGIRRSEINRVTDWNTYQIDGLPKTPICNPGREALAAVLNPAQTDAIYFVADGSGGHVFAKTLEQHNQNVAKWRKIEKKMKAAQKVKN